MSELKQAIEAVLSYPKLEERVQGRAQDIARVKELVEEIHGEFHPSVVKSTSKFLNATFLKLYDNLNIDGQSQTGLEKLQNNYHVVLVPNHQSHADYVAITYLVYNHYNTPLYVAGGVNLDVFPIGKLFRNSGCFFIRRSFGREILYKTVFEGYIYYLLKSNKMMEFFFEGGRSRTGKLLSPRFGLFQMLLEAHSLLETDKPLLFIPVSIAHEYVPESSAHLRELEGGKKKAESTAEILKLYKMFFKRFGSIHVRLGEGIAVSSFKDLKEDTQKLAFQCFRQVGKGIPITPTALLSLVLLDEAAGASTWDTIEEKAYEIIDYCETFDIPLTSSLQEDLWSDSLRRALDLAIKNKNVRIIEKEKLRQTFYFIEENSRAELLYFKNMILHHFLVPSLMTSSWFKLFTGSISNASELTKFLMMKRKELKYEFYLPSVKELISKALRIVSWALGRKIESLDECLHLSSQELYKIAFKLRNFTFAFNSIYEAYYVAGVSLKHLLHEKFNFDKFYNVSKEIFEMERTHGRVVKYPEGHTKPIMRNCLEFYLNQKVLTLKAGKYTVENYRELDQLIEKFARDLHDQIAVNLKLSS